MLVLIRRKIFNKKKNEEGDEYKNDKSRKISKEIDGCSQHEQKEDVDEIEQNMKRTRQAEREYQEKFLTACHTKLKKEAITWTDIFKSSLPNQIAILDEIITNNPNLINVIPNFMLNTCSPPGWGKAQENTLLHYAMLSGEKEFIDLFRKHRADLTVKNFFKQRPLDLYQQPDRAQYIRFIERDSILITIAFQHSGIRSLEFT